MPTYAWVIIAVVVIAIIWFFLRGQESSPSASQPSEPKGEAPMSFQEPETPPSSPSEMEGPPKTP